MREGAVVKLILFSCWVPARSNYTLKLLGAFNHNMSLRKNASVLDQWNLALKLVLWSQWAVQSHLHEGVTNRKAASVNMALSLGEEKHI